jgi:hypothetical protein
MQRISDGGLEGQAHPLRRRAPTNFTYWYDVKEWQKRDDIELVLTIAITCGPPIVVKFALIGICGRCNVGPKYVCVDGPVFSLAELKELPDEL